MTVSSSFWFTGYYIGGFLLNERIKDKVVPSVLRYNKEVLLMQALSIAALLWTGNATKHYFQNFLISLVSYCLIIPICAILSANLWWRIRWCIVADLKKWIYYDFLTFPAEHDKAGPDLAYWLKAEVYHFRRERSSTDCAICLEPLEYESDLRLSLLPCGHVYHADCLSDYEVSQWHDPLFAHKKGKYSHPWSRCPTCTRRYHFEHTKFNYDAQVEHEVRPQYSYHGDHHIGGAFLFQHVWSRMNTAYRVQWKAEWKRYYGSRYRPHCAHCVSDSAEDEGKDSDVVDESEELEQEQAQAQEDSAVQATGSSDASSEGDWRSQLKDALTLVRRRCTR